MANTFKLAGHVFDNSGAPSVGATVTTHTAGATTSTGAAATTNTDSAGYWEHLTQTTGVDVKIAVSSDIRWLRTEDRAILSELAIVESDDGQVANLYLAAGRADQAGDSWRTQVKDRGTAITYAIGNDRASQGSYVDLLTITGHATATSSLVTAAGALTVAGLITANGGITFAAGDDIAFTGSTGTNDITLTDSLADALSITRGGTDMVVFNSSTPSITFTPATTFTGAITADGGVVGALTGTASSATEVVASANNSANETVYPTFVDGTTGSQGIETDSGFTYNPSSGLLTISGELDAGSLDISGNADIDGTANLDIVDIDGALTQDGGAVFNEDSADVDFRVESDGNANMLFVDGGNNRVGIGVADPTTALEIGETGGANLSLRRVDANTIIGEELGAIWFKADDPSASQSGGAIRAFAETGNWSSNSYPTAITFWNDVSGTSTERMRLNSSGNLGIGTNNPSEKLYIENSTDSTDVGMTIANTGSAGGEDALVNLYAHASGGDPVIRWNITGTEAWSMGIDNSDSDKLLISNGSTLPGTDYLAFSGNQILAGVSAMIEQQSITSSSNAVAWNAKTQANAYHVTTENTTFSAPSNATEGAIISVEIAQGGTARTIAWNTVFEFAASTAPTMTATANKTDIYSFRYNGSVWQEIGRVQNMAQT